MLTHVSVIKSPLYFSKNNLSDTKFGIEESEF